MPRDIQMTRQVFKNAPGSTFRSNAVRRPPAPSAPGKGKDKDNKDKDKLSHNMRLQKPLKLDTIVRLMTNFWLDVYSNCMGILGRDFALCAPIPHLKSLLHSIKL